MNFLSNIFDGQRIAPAASKRGWVQLAVVCLLVFPAGLGGCSLSSAITRDVADYQSAAANAANKALLVNILRAEDSEPLHFAELTQIRGAISTQLSLTTAFPFGELHKSTTRAVANPSLQVSTSPTFDLGAVDTQDFVRGITTPIDPRVITYLIDSGLDPRVALLLFFSEVELPDGDEIFNNSDCGALTEEDCRSNLVRYADFAASIGGDSSSRSFFGHYYTELRPIGDPFHLDVAANLKNLTDMDPMKFELRRIGDRYQLFSTSQNQKTVFCTEDADHRPFVVAFANSNRPKFNGDYDRACSEREVTVDPNARNPGQTVLWIRSVFGIIQYLGGVLRIQRQLGPGQCILTHANRTPGQLLTGPCNTSDVLFRAEPDIPEPLVQVVHRDQTFAVSRIRPAECIGKGKACDASSEVLSTLTLLLDLNRNAKDILATPAVQGVP